MKALVVERSPLRFAAAWIGDSIARKASTSQPWTVRLADLAPPQLPGEGWVSLKPLLAGICGSDLATVTGHSSRWFEPIVSFPFVPGHEVVGVDEAGRRVVLEAVLGCRSRAIEPPCPACARGDVGNCEMISMGELPPGLQTGFCRATGGGWSQEMVAHESQLREVPEAFSDEDAVMVEPAACAVHAALRAEVRPGEVVGVIGAGTLGLCVLGALRRYSDPGHLVIAAKHPHQRQWAGELGADFVAEPASFGRSIRRATKTMQVARRLTGGADVVIDCVGSPSSLALALDVVRPRGRVVLAGMPEPTRLDLTPLWQREISLLGAYTYGKETSASGQRSSFELAFELVAEAGLGRMVSARYPLERYREALAHAIEAGSRGAIKIVFEPQARARSRGGMR
jgi:threonine dehydrogenase-like Zn-dependent dehydrogenase